MEHGRPRSGRPRTARTEEKIEQVRDSVRENPSTSIRKQSTQVVVSRSSMQRILRSLKLFPYKVQLVQQLKPQDYEQRLQYAIRVQELSRNDPKLTNKLIISDEAHFHLNGFVISPVTTFFMWGYLKERVFINTPRTLEELKNNIRQEIRNVQPPILEAVMESLMERTRLCEEKNGHYLKDVIFHK